MTKSFEPQTPVEPPPATPSHRMIVTLSALALATLLGFGVGVTFQAGRDAEILAGLAPGAPPAAPVAAPAASTREPPARPSAAAPAEQPVAEKPAAEKPAAPASALVDYAYVTRYEKDGAYAYDVKSRKFETVAVAREAAISECRQKGGRNCKFNFAPAGTCIAVAKPTLGQYRVSPPEADEGSASAEARALCLQDRAGACRIEKVLCP